MNPALSQEFNLFCEQEHPQRHADTDKFHTVDTAPLTSLHQEYPHRKKRIPPLSRKLVFFANRNTQKNMQLLDKIHAVFTALRVPYTQYMDFYLELHVFGAVPVRKKK